MSDPQFTSPILTKEGVPVGNPPAGYLYVYAEGGTYKQKDSSGVITDLGAGGGATTLNGLSDVTITTPAYGQILQRGASVFENETPSGPWASEFDFTAISGCKLWLDSTDSSTLYDAVSGGSLTGSGGYVRRWQDKSGNGNHATENTSPPTRVVGGLNSLDVLLFNSQLLTLTSNITTSGGASLFMVFKTLTSTNGGVHGFSGYSIYNNHHPYEGGFYDGFASGNRYSWAQAFSTDTRVYSVIVSSSYWKARINGSEVYSAASPPLANQYPRNVQNFGIGGNGYYCNAHIGQAVVYDVPVSDTDRDLIEAELIAKWI
jgi:hypothetical protein